jgi:hypothetical protein
VLPRPPLRLLLLLLLLLHRVRLCELRGSRFVPPPR